MKNTASTSGFPYKRFFIEKKAIIFLPLITLLAGFCLCTTTTGPGGTDFPNTKTAVVGHITNEDGSAGSSTIVHLVPDDFNPLTDTQNTISDSTDSSGYFQLMVKDSGTYNLHAVHSESGNRLMVRAIEIDKEKDSVSIGVEKLEQPGAMIVALPESAPVTGGHVYLPGTFLSVPVPEGQRHVLLDSIPAGTVPSIYFTEADTAVESPILIQDSAVVVSGDTTVIAPEKGTAFIKVFLNTTDSGAGIADEVYHFPVAIRLASLPVDMGEMAADGSDLTVTDSTLQPLPAEIETWDTEKGDALVWVLIDTITANSATQFIYLFWGNENRSTSTSTKPVFDTAQGFSGVWHLADGADDATGNDHDGDRGEGVLSTAGILGGAQQFHGDDSIVIPGLLDTPSTVTLSAWAKLDTTVEYGAEVVSIGDAVLIRMDDIYYEKGCQGSYHSFPDSSYIMTHDFVGSGSFLAQTGWHLFTYIFDGENMVHRLYIDGEFCCDKEATVPIHYDSIGTNVVIGDHGNEKVGWNFIGSIDEVRIDTRVPSASWIRLCYMNQRADDKLLFVKK